MRYRLPSGSSVKTSAARPILLVSEYGGSTKVETSCVTDDAATIRRWAGQFPAATTLWVIDQTTGAIRDARSS